MFSFSALAPVITLLSVLILFATCARAVYGRPNCETICSTITVRPACTVDRVASLLMCLPVGSLERCDLVPDDLKAVYRTVWDMDPAALVDMAIDRAPFVDQSQSLTLGVRRPSPELLVRPSIGYIRVRF